MNEKGEQFYDFVKAQGINVPNSYDEFKTAMQDANTASQFHAFVIDKNISVPESVEEFQSTFSDGGADVNFTEGSVEQQEQPTEPLEKPTVDVDRFDVPETDEYLSGAREAAAKELRETEKLLSGVAKSPTKVLDYKSYDPIQLDSAMSDVDKKLEQTNFILSTRGLTQPQRTTAKKERDRLKEEKAIATVVRAVENNNYGMLDDAKEAIAFVGPNRIVGKELSKEYEKLESRVNNDINEKFVDIDFNKLTEIDNQGIKRADVAKISDLSDEIATSMAEGDEAVRQLVYEKLFDRAENNRFINESIKRASENEVIQKLQSDNLSSFQDTNESAIKFKAEASSSAKKINDKTEIELNVISQDYTKNVKNYFSDLQSKVSQGLMTAEDAQKDYDSYNQELYKNLKEQQNLIVNEAESSIKGINELYSQKIQKGYEEFSKNNPLSQEERDLLSTEYGKIYEEIRDDEFKRLKGQETLDYIKYGGAGLAFDFGKSLNSTLSRAISGAGTYFGSPSLVEIGDEMNTSFSVADEPLENWSDLANIPAVTKSIGRLAGSAAPSIIVGSAVSAGTAGLGTVPAMALVATTGFVTESIDMAGNIKRDVIRETGSLLKGEQAAGAMWEAQMGNWWTYLGDGLPFVSKALKFIPSKTGRILTAGGESVATETPQEIFQTSQEQKIMESVRSGEEISAKGFMELITPELAKSTFLEVAPGSLFLGGGSRVVTEVRMQGQANQIVRDLIDNINLNGVDKSQSFIKQKIFSSISRHGKNFTNSWLSTLQENGAITEEQLTELYTFSKTAEGFSRNIKNTNLTDEQQQTYFGLSHRANELFDKADAITDDKVLKSSITQEANELKKNAQSFLSNPDTGGSFVTVKIGKSPALVLTESEAIEFVTNNPYVVLPESGVDIVARNADEFGGILEQMVEGVEAGIADLKSIDDGAEFTPTEDAATVTEAVEEDVTLDDISKKYEDVTLDVFEKENVLSLDKIIVPEGNRGEGIGSNVMQDLIDYADKNNLKIILTPSKDFGATSVTRLKKFYKQFGFIDNKGKNRDFSHKESMYRNPEEVVSKTEEVVEEVPKEAPIVTDDAGKDITVYRGGKPASGVQFYTDDQKLAEDIGKAKDEGVQKATVRMENPWTPESLDVNNAPQWMKDWVRSREEFTTVDEETMAAEEIPMEQAIQEIKDMRLSFRDVSLWQSFVNETLKHHDGIIAFDPSEDMATDKKIYITKSPEQVVTEEVTEEVTEDTTKGKKEITEVKSGTHTSSNPIKIFKGLAGKQDLSGARINAHEGAKGVFTAVDEDLANEYAKDKGMSETILPAGTTFEVVEIDGTGMTPGQYRAAEVKAINDSKADVVKLITVDGRIKAGTKKQEQYIVKNEELIKEVRKPTKEPVKKDVNAEVRTLNDNFVEDEKGFFGKKRRPIGDIVSFAKKNNISEEALTMFLKDKKYSEKQIESAISTLNQEIDMSAKVVTWLPDFANKALEKAYEQIGDKYYRLLKLQKQTSAKTNRILSEEVDAYLATELETSKIAESINKFKNRIIKSKRKQDPALIERMSKDNISVESLGLYMYAMHATERNEFLKQRAIDEGKEGNLEGLSGMTNEQAQEILDSIPTNTKEKLGEYASEFRKEVIIKRIDNLKDSGLINDETADRLKNTYKNYVPLKVEEFESTKTATTAPRKIGVKGNVIWKAKGSNFFDAQSRRNPVIESINAYIQDDIKSERNRTFQTLMGLTREIDDKNILEIYRPRYQEMTDGLGNKVFIPLHKEPPNQSISGNVDGKVVYIIAKDKDLFKSLNNVPQGNYSTAVKVLQGVNSYLRNVNTLLNPEFIATNFARDIQTALINISAEDARKMSLQMIKNIPNAAKGIFQNEKGVESKWSKIYQELKDNGGDISWLDINSVDKIQKEVVKAEKAYRKNPTQSKLKDLMMIMGGFFTSTIKASEMATRLAAYQAAIENNYPPKKAASLAKNLTVNFEKKGFAGNIINTFYLFANAGLQGSFRIFKALGKKGRGGNRARAIVTGIIATSFLNAMLNELNDDEDELELLTDSDRDRKMVWKLSDGGSITIPLPYGYNVFWALGQNMYRYVSEKTNASQFMAATISSVNGAFNPFSSAIDDDAGAALIQSITPTAVKPIVEIGMNKNWNAAPIKPEQPPFGPKKKESELYFSTVRKPSRKVTEFLSELGVAEISPEIIDYTVDFVGGGLGRFITNSGELIYDVATGEDVPEYRIPFYRQFYMKPNERNIIPFIYEINANREIQDFTEREEKLYKKYLLKAFKDGLIDNSKYNRMRSDFDEAKYKRKAAKKDSFFD